jgi:hypothetical protein
MYKAPLLIVGIMIAIPVGAQVRSDRGLETLGIDDQQQQAPATTPSRNEPSDVPAIQPGHRQAAGNAAPNIKPMGRLQSRINSRIQSRIQSRVNSGDDTQTDTASAFRAAEDRSRKIQR